MADTTIALAYPYKGWDNYQQLLVQTITPLTAEQLELRAAPSLRSIGELSAHVIGARARWWYELMGEGGSEMAAYNRVDHSDTKLDTAGLVQGLETTWKVIQETLQRWNITDLEQVFKTTRGGKEYTFTRQWVIWHVIEHDLHHGGEISFSLGMHGLRGLDL